MPEPRSPLQRPIGGSGILRFLIAIVGVLAIAGAFNAGRPVLGIGGALFVCGAPARAPSRPGAPGCGRGRGAQ